MKKKSQPVYPILLAVVPIILFSLCMAACHDPSSPSRTGNSFSVVMYGVEVTADGTVLQTEEFTLAGTVYDNGDDRDTIALEPIKLSEAGVTLKIEEEYPLHDHTYLHADMVSYLAQNNRYEDVDLGLSADFSNCVIIVDDRIFLGSAAPDFDPVPLLEYYQYIIH